MSGQQRTPPTATVATAVDTSQFPANASSGNRTINIPNADKVYVAKNIIETKIHVGGDGDSNNLDTDEAEDSDVEECGSVQELLKDKQESIFHKWTQTYGLVCSGRPIYRIADNYTHLNLYLTKEAAEIISSGNLGDLQKIGDAIGSKCLARLEWIGDAMGSSTMTAWKMSIKDGMEKLCTDVTEIAFREKNYTRLRRAIKTAFREGMKLMGLDVGSLVFIFQHVEGADVREEWVKKSLQGLLPDWVNKEDVEWDVKPCSGSTVRDTAECEFSDPIPLLEPQAARVTPLIDYRHMERVIERTLERHMHSIQRYITNTQEVTLQHLAKKQTDVLQGFIQTFMEQYRSQTTSLELPELHPSAPQTPSLPGDPSSLVADTGSITVDPTSDNSTVNLVTPPPEKKKLSAHPVHSAPAASVSGVREAESGVTKAESGFTKAESSVTEAEIGITKAESGFSKAESSVTEAESGFSKAVSAAQLAEQDVVRKPRSLGKGRGSVEGDSGTGLVYKPESAQIADRSEKRETQHELYPIREEERPLSETGAVPKIALEKGDTSSSHAQAKPVFDDPMFTDQKDVDNVLTLVDDPSSSPIESSQSVMKSLFKQQQQFPVPQVATAAPASCGYGQPPLHSKPVFSNKESSTLEDIQQSMSFKHAKEQEEGAAGGSDLVQPHSKGLGKDTEDSEREYMALMREDGAKSIRTEDVSGKGRAPHPHRKQSGEETTQRPEDDSSSSSAEGETAQKPKKNQESKKVQAEQLLDWVNVKSQAAQSSDPEIQRLMQQVELALMDEEVESTRARALDTVLVLDTSDSVVTDHLDELKMASLTFIDGIEDNVDTRNLEENLAVVQMGSRAWVRQHLTNDYNRVRDTVDAMTPDSETMRTGGRTAMFQALMVCLGALEGKGGAVGVAGCHRVRPRLIFFTDGRPTDEASELGADIQSNVNEVKFSLVQLISEFASKKHKTTPAPIFWVPIGSNADRPFMESLAALSGGEVVEKENMDVLCRYYKVQETIGCVFKMVRKYKDQTEQQTLSIVNALAGDLEDREKQHILEEVRKKQKEAENESEKADDFDSVFEDTELVNVGFLLPLGTRVVRGEHWKWNSQDTDGPGTVIQHRKKRDGWIYVMWDNGTNNAYRYGEYQDIRKSEDDPRVLTESQLIEIGVKVKRGPDWLSGEEDGRKTGIVIRKRKDGKVKVRWDTGNIGKYKFGADGKFELEICEECKPRMEAVGARSPTPVQHEESAELGATGGFDPAEGVVRRVWQWKDNVRQCWRTYSADVQDKMLNAYNQRHDGSCIITRGGVNRRVSFAMNQEKTVDKKGAIVLVQSKDVSEVEYVRLLQEEENLGAPDGSS